MRLALAQINPLVGDLEGNRRLILDRLAEAKANAADLVLFPELAVTGYPPEDLLLRPGFVRAAESCVEAIARETRRTTVLLGAPHFDRDLFNACYVLSGGEVKAVYRKRFLPNYGVFDEDRYFAPGRDLILLEHGTTLVGPTVCEDMWQPGPPATDLALAGAELLESSRRRVDEPAAQQQVLRRITRHDELGEEKDVHALRLRLVDPRQYPLRVAVEIADDRIDLREPEPHEAQSTGFCLSVENRLTSLGR